MPRFKYAKGIKIYKLKIFVTDKNNFYECNRAILQELDRHPEIDEKEKKQFVKEVLS